MHNLKRIFILSILFFYLNNTLAQENTIISSSGLNNSIDVGSPGFQKIKISIPNFFSNDNNLFQDNSDFSMFTHRFQEILNFTNWFEFHGEEHILSNKSLVVNGFQSQDWISLKTDYVVTGRFIAGPSKTAVDLELRLYSVRQNQMLVGKLYKKISRQSIDIALRRFADVLIDTLTGIPGPFMSKIAFVGTQIKGTPQIYITDFDGKNTIQITKNRAINISPSWSPDGKKITYTSFVSGKAQIYQYNLETQKTVQMTFPPMNASGSCWSGDGNNIAFSVGSDTGYTQIYLMNSFGGSKQEFINSGTISVEPAFSKDGKHVAFTSNLHGKPMIFIKNLNTKEINQLTFAGWYNASPSWSPDDKVIAFASYDRDIDRWDLFKIRPNGTQMERLTLKQGDNEKPSFSPDGRFLVYQSTRNSDFANNIHSSHKIYVMSQDGTYTKHIVLPVRDAKQPAWSPRLNELSVSTH